MGSRCIICRGTQCPLSPPPPPPAREPSTGVPHVRVGAPFACPASHYKGQHPVIFRTSGNAVIGAWTVFGGRGGLVFGFVSGLIVVGHPRPTMHLCTPVCHVRVIACAGCCGAGRWQRPGSGWPTCWPTTVTSPCCCRRPTPKPPTSCQPPWATICRYVCVCVSPGPMPRGWRACSFFSAETPSVCSSTDHAGLHATTAHPPHPPPRPTLGNKPWSPPLTRRGTCLGTHRWVLDVGLGVQYVPGAWMDGVRCT
jgi:hypothetical protein